MSRSMGGRGRLRLLWLLVVVCPGMALAQLANPAGAATATAPPLAMASIPFAPAHAAPITVPSAPSAWGGERSGHEATLSDRVVSYRIKAELDAARHAVTGSEQLTWRNRSDCLLYTSPSPRDS